MEIWIKTTRCSASGTDKPKFWLYRSANRDGLDNYIEEIVENINNDFWWSEKHRGVDVEIDCLPDLDTLGYMIDDVKHNLESNKEYLTCLLRTKEEII